VSAGLVHIERDQHAFINNISRLDNKPRLIVEDTAQWINRQYKTLDLPDTRLTNRCLQTVITLAQKPQDSINQASENWAQAKGAYRFIENDRVTAEALQTPISDAAAQACAHQDTIIAVQDTTTLSFDSARQAKGLGTVNDSSNARGMFYHPVLALREDGLSLGLLDQQHWCREPEVEHKAKDRYERSINEKESAKWLKGVAAAHLALKTNLPPEKRPHIIHVFDREGDVHEVFQLIETFQDQAVIRSAHNRRVVTEQGQTGYAHELVRKAPLLGEITIDVSRKPGQKKRKANLQLRAARVTLTPKKHKHPDRYPVALTLVEAFEIESPVNTTPLHWLLWTNESVHDLSKAKRIMHIYTLRWKIEDFFLTFKQGCRIEKVQFETSDRLAKVVSLLAPIALRILQCRDLARLEPEAPATVVLSEDEWKTLWAYIHKKPPSNTQPPISLKQAVLWIGRLGGHLGRKSDGMPGVKTLWLGLRDLTLMTMGYKIAQS
jgi:hypothetical protein